MSKRKVTRGSPPKLARSRSRKWTDEDSHSQGTVQESEKKHRLAGAKEEAESEVEEEGPNFLGVYFREMSSLTVMTPEEELATATRIASLRLSYWNALLSYPPFIDGIITLIEKNLSVDDMPTTELMAMRRASRNLRDRETSNHKQEYDEYRLTLVHKMVELDVDGIISDMIAADLETIDAGHRQGLNMTVTLPRQGSRPFQIYVQKARSTGAALRSAKNAFVKANLRLVVSIARRFNHGRMPLQDLIQEGNIGLMKAVDRFDYRKGFRFSTYGSWWIRHAISRAIADKGRAVRLPVHMIDAYHKLTKAKRELELLHGRDPSTSELAEHTGLTVSKIERMGSLLLDQAISLDRAVSDEDGRKIVDFLEDQDSEAPGESLEAKAISEQVRQVIMSLRPIEADILRKRFGLEEDNELTLKEIGEQYSLSRERIRQLQEQALGKIRRELKRREVV